MTLDEKMQAVIKEIRDTRGRTMAGSTGEDLRPWLNFAGIAEAGKFDFDGMLQIFDRKKLDDDYMKARGSAESLSKDAWIPKLSGELLAGFQRDHLMRMRSRARLLMHSAARARSDGKDNGPFTANTLTLFARIDTAQRG